MAGLERISGSRRGLSGTALKWIALFSMTLSHAAIALEPVLGQKVVWSMNQAGRPAFIIFAFLLAEGFAYTRSWGQYLKRLLILALLSEIPYDLAIFGKIVDFTRQNVFWTLAIGLSVLRLWEKEKRLVQVNWGAWPANGPSGWKDLLLAATVFAGALAAWALRTDYDAVGILLIAWFYWARDSRILQLAGAFGIFLMFVGTEVFGASCLSLIFLGMYNGKRGRNPHPAFFYWYYPIHLAVLALVGIGMA